MFSDLNLVKKGDVFYLRVLNKTLAYQADRIQTVLPDQTESLAIDKNKDYVTLVTCTPYAVNTHRLLIRGHRIPYTGAAGRDGSSGHARRDMARLKWQILSALAGFAAAAVIVSAILKIRERKMR